jgi:hypothetical protein
MKIIKTLLICLLVLFSPSLFSQELKNLKEKNGFREIKLGTDVSKYPYLIKQDSSNKKFFGNMADYDYIVNHKYTKKFDSVGNGEIKKVVVKTYQKKIFQILLLVDDYYFSIEKMLELNFGKSTSIFNSSLEWETEGINLTLFGCVTENSQINCNHLMLIYTDIELSKAAEIEKLKRDKAKAESEF